MEQIYTDTAKVLKAISDPKRLKIVDMLSCGELCACKILEAFHITQPTLSHDMRVLIEAGVPTLSHDMRVLIEAGVVIDRRDGKNIYYSLNADRLSAFHETLKHIFEEKADCICHRKE